MATMIGLMNQFKESFKKKAEVACGGSSQTRNDTQKKAKDDLLGSFLDERVTEGLKWAKEEDDSRARLIHRIMRTKPNDDDIETYKGAFTKNHKHALERLQDQHARQLDQLETWLEIQVKNKGFSEKESKDLIRAWKTAQAEQINELEKRHQDDQKRLTNFNRHSDQIIAARKILRAASAAGDKDKKNKKIVQDYHFSPFAFIRKKIRKDEVDYDTAGELDIKYAEKFNLYEATTGTKEKEEKEESSLSKKLKKRNEEEKLIITPGNTQGDWEVLADDTHFSKQSEHVYTNLGTSLFGGIGPFKEEIVVKLHQSVPADKKTGLPAAEGVISTVCYKGDSIEKKRIYLGILANEAMAQGWTSVNLGRLPADIQEEAYIAFRRAGFSHDQLEMNGRSFSPKSQKEGNDARDKIEAVYKNKATTEIEKLGTLTALTFQTSEVDEKLKPAVFFTLSENDRKDLFSKPSPVEHYERHIAILSEASIHPQILDACINAVADSRTKVDLLFNMSTTPDMEWDKLTTVFNAIKPDKKVEVFKGLFEKKLEKKVDDEQINQALFAILRDCPILANSQTEQLVAKLLKGLDNKGDVPNRKAIHLLRDGLKEGELSPQKVYNIYKTLRLEQADLEAILFEKNSLPWEKTPESTIQFMAAIIVGMFSENKENEAFTLLNTCMSSKIHEDSQFALMEEIYRTLPSNLRIRPLREKEVEIEGDIEMDDLNPPPPPRDSFDSALQKWINNKTKGLIVSERLSPTYAQAVRNNPNPRSNPADLKAGLDPESEVDLADFYTVPTKQAAHVLREVNADSRAATLVDLCKTTTDNEQKKKLTQIIRELGPKAFAEAINAITSWEGCNNLLSLLANNQKNRTFLADTVGFLFTSHPNFDFENLQISLVDGAPKRSVLQALLPQIHNPELIYVLAKKTGLNVNETDNGPRAAPTYKFDADNIIDFCATLPNDDGDAQRITVFQSLGGCSNDQLSAKITALMALQASHNPQAARYEQLFFNHLNKEGQTLYLKELVDIVRKAAGKPDPDATRAANTLMTHLNTPYRVEAFKTIFGDSGLKSVVKATTQPSVAVLKHYLETCCASTDKFTQDDLDAILKKKVRHNPPNAFKETTQKQLGDAIAQLVNPTQTELFVAQFDKLILQQDDQSKHQIRLQTLIHLLDQPDGVNRGQKLIEELGKTNPNSKQTLVTLINGLPDSPDNQKLKKMGNPPAPPAAATTPGTTPPLQAH